MVFAVMAVSATAFAAAPAHAAEKGVTVYFQNSKSWENVYCYMWYGSGSVGKAWPGAQITKVEGTTDWYQAIYTGDKPLNVIFNDNGKPKVTQTANHTPANLAITQDAYWFTLAATTSQNAGGEGGGTNLVVNTTAKSGWPTPAAATDTSKEAAKTDNSKDATPKTGDNSKAPIAAVIGLAAAAGLVVEGKRKKEIMA